MKVKSSVRTSRKKCLVSYVQSNVASETLLPYVPSHC